MAGFFKKLFNRIVGNPIEEILVEPAAPAALPAPAPEAQPEPEVTAVKPAVKAARAKPRAKKVVAKIAVEKKPPVKKTAAKNAPVQKTVAKKTAVKPTAKTVAKPVALAAPQKKLAPTAKEVVAKPRPATVVPEIVKPSTVIAKKEIAPPPLPPAVIPSAPLPVPEPVARAGWFSKLKEGLSKSSKSIGGSITSIFTKRKLDKDTLQDLEDTLVQADLGMPVAERIIARVSQGRFDKEIDPEEVKQILADEVAKVLKPVEVPFNFGAEKPFVVMVVGVNGSGKTTTIGKLGSIAAGEGFKVMFAACDTFRAAAIEQLTVWGKRIGAETMSRPTGADSAGLAFDALKAAKENGTDILFIDTAGRLQNKAYLMDELDKVVRVIKKQDETAPHAVLLVLDATTGQNALSQVHVFSKVAGVTGLIMTKLDGTARGGILVAIAEKFKLPIHAIGVGESIDDLQPFDAQGFARAIAGLENT